MNEQATRKSITACVERVAKAFGGDVDSVLIEFTVRLGWVIRVETPALDRRSSTGRTRRTLPDTSSGLGETLRDAEGDIMRRVRWHRSEQAQEVERDRLRALAGGRA